MNSPNIPSQPLLFPCLFAMTHGLVPVDRRAATKLVLKKFLTANRFLLRRGESRGMQVQFIIDRLGEFRSVRKLGTSRSWTRPISFLYDFSVSEVEISPGVQLANGDLADRLARSAKSWDPHVSAASKLSRYLKSKPKNGAFDAAEFREFWDTYCFPIADDKWIEQVP